MKFTRRHLPLLLAVLMLATVLPLSLTSCLHTANTIADAALEALENYENSDIQSAETGETPETGSIGAPTGETIPPETEPETEKQTAPETKAPETAKETEPETKAPETVKETKAPETTVPETKAPETEAETEPAPVIDENGWYDDKDNVALYIHTYGKLPPNYVSKNDAEDLYGWTGGALDKYEKGMAIGGSKFGNYEGILPKKSGRQYYECDIGTVGTSSRGAKRIVYSNDGLIYYTDDHYESFELLYGEE